MQQKLPEKANEQPWMKIRSFETAYFAGFTKTHALHHWLERLKVREKQISRTFHELSRDKCLFRLWNMIPHDSRRIACSGYVYKFLWKLFPLTRRKTRRRVSVWQCHVAKKSNRFSPRLSANAVRQNLAAEQEIHFTIDSAFFSSLSVQMQNVLIDVLCQQVSRGKTASFASGWIVSQWVIKSLGAWPRSAGEMFSY